MSVGHMASERAVQEELGTGRGNSSVAIQSN